MPELKENLIRLGAQKPRLQKHLRPILDHLTTGNFLGFDGFDDVPEMENTLSPNRKRYLDLKRGDTFKVGRKRFRVIKDQGIVKIVNVEDSAGRKLFEAIPSSSDEQSDIIEVYEIDGMSRRKSTQPYAQGRITF